MKFYVPALGSKFRLTKPWEFILYKEYRNDSLFRAFGKYADQLIPVRILQKAWGGTREEMAYRFSLPAKTVLSVDRIYIRKGASDFDSITMKIFETTHPFILFAAKKKDGTISASKARFWVKLCDFNKIEAEVIEDKVSPHKFAK